MTLPCFDGSWQDGVSKAKFEYLVSNSWHPSHLLFKSLHLWSWSYLRFPDAPQRFISCRCCYHPLLPMTSCRLWNSQSTLYTVKCLGMWTKLLSLTSHCPNLHLLADPSRGQLQLPKEACYSNLPTFVLHSTSFPLPTNHSCHDSVTACYDRGCFLKW